MKMRPVWDNVEVRVWLDRFERDVLPMLRDSECSITLYSGQFDAKLAIELGAAVLLDKPIIVVATTDAKIPRLLAKVAAGIVVGDPTKEDVRRRLMETITAALPHKA